MDTCSSTMRTEPSSLVSHPRRWVRAPTPSIGTNSNSQMECLCPHLALTFPTRSLIVFLPRSIACHIQLTARNEIRSSTGSNSRLGIEASLGMSITSLASVATETGSFVDFPVRAPYPLRIPASLPWVEGVEQPPSQTIYGALIDNRSRFGHYNLKELDPASFQHAYHGQIERAANPFRTILLPICLLHASSRTPLKVSKV